MKWLGKLLRCVIVVLLVSIAFLQGWHRGFDVGYGAGICDIFYNLITPEQYFKRLLHVPNHNAN